ncbi:unnamed protein product [Ilex paraguariensis]|uniref:Uncharacterized protein n=1 Tax=Ilex paraguariensis TaxID=185542 RepID=A0ABC8RHI0_9AQUA
MFQQVVLELCFNKWYQNNIPTKLPKFFNREVYDIVDGGGGSKAIGPTGLVLALAPSNRTEGEKVEVEAVFDSGWSAAPEDRLFSYFEDLGQKEIGGSTNKEFKKGPTKTTNLPAPIPISGTTHEKQLTSNPEPGTTQEGWKRKRFAMDEEEETTNVLHQVIDALEKNGKLLSSQLEAQNTNFQLDREQ